MTGRTPSSFSAATASTAVSRGASAIAISPAAPPSTATWTTVRPAPAISSARGARPSRDTPLPLQQRAVADENAAAVDGGDRAVAGDRLELIGTQPLDTTLLGRFDDRLGERMLALALDRRHEPKQLLLADAVGGDLDHLRLAAGKGAGLVEHDRVKGGGLLDRESQGFLDAWAPVFFFAMIFAISMDYTVFLLASAKEHYDRTGDPREAAIGGLAHSGRVIFAAAAVMVAIFFTFALSGPLPPKEMGVILGIAVLLDAMLIRLVLMPTLLRVFGHRAWALPRWLGRILPNVSFGHG